MWMVTLCLKDGIFYGVPEFDSNQPFEGCRDEMSVSLVDFLVMPGVFTLLTLLDAAIYGVARGSPISATLLDYLFVVSAGNLAFIFEPSQ
jgi:hypothetical protein